VGKELEATVKQVASALGAVGIMAAKNGEDFDAATEEVAKALERVGVSAAGSDLETVAKENIAKDAVKNLLKIGNKAKEKGLEYAPETVVISLEAVGKAVANKNLKCVALEAVLALDSLIDKKFEDMMSRIAGALKAVGNVTIKNKNLKTPTKVAVCSLIKLKKDAEKNNFPDVQKEAEEYINDLKKSNSEIVQNAIDECKY
jgi:hypothetical protein